MSDALDAEVRWAGEHMPRTARALAALPPLDGMRLALNVHLDVKLIRVVEILQAKGAAVHVTTCNPATVRDEVLGRLRETGATVVAARAMSESAWRASIDDALDWAPTHASEMGAAITLRAHGREALTLLAAQEITGSGLTALRDIELRIPVIDVDTVPVKTDLHNRHLVGFSAWHTFTERTHLTLHERRVAVVGYGAVGQGVALAARARGAVVVVCERDPGRRLMAAYDAFAVEDIHDALRASDVVVTATGATGVIGPSEIDALQPGTFLLNVGHHTGEIDVQALYAHEHEEVRPAITAVRLPGRTVYLLADGAMVNLAAGWGDGLNTFDVTLAVIIAGMGALREAEALPPGIHPLAPERWRPVLAGVGSGYGSPP